MSKTIGIAKKLRAIYDQDPSLFDKYSPEELIQMMHSMSIPADEPEDMIYEDEYIDPSERTTHGGHRDE